MVVSSVTQVWEPQEDALSHAFPSQRATGPQQVHDRSASFR